jgi:hypothetical protein
MGQPTLAKFQNTLRLIEQQNWPDAAESLRHSEWFHEVGPLPTQRGGADVSVLRGTCTPASILGLSPDLAANLGNILSLNQVTRRYTRNEVPCATTRCLHPPGLYNPSNHPLRSP